MKWNWGYGIFIFYGLFVLLLAIQLIRSFQYDRSLVVEDYYAKDLAYQEQFDRIENTMLQKADIVIHTKEDSLFLQFPDTHRSPEGTIHFYRADNELLDRTWTISLNEDNQQSFATSEFVTGKWKIKVSWEWDGSTYFSEKDWIAP